MQDVRAVIGLIEKECCRCTYCLVVHNAFIFLLVLQHFHKHLILSIVKPRSKTESSNDV